MSVETSPARRGRSAEMRFAHHVHGLGVADGPPGVPPGGFERPPGPAPFDVSIGLGGAGRSGAWAMLRAASRFLIDAANGAVTPAELARMIGCFACAADPEQREADVSLRNDAGLLGAAQVACPAFEVEVNGFGAAHILHESAILGLYVLEVAPGRAIPAHFHRVMQEAELVLDAGLTLQGRPVNPGDAFVWPTGHVHAYANPANTPRRILCIDRPKFIPEDEVVVPGPAELVALAPARNYLA